MILDLLQDISEFCNQIYDQSQFVLLIKDSKPLESKIQKQIVLFLVNTTLGKLQINYCIKQRLSELCKLVTNMSLVTIKSQLLNDRRKFSGQEITAVKYFHLLKLTYFYTVDKSLNRAFLYLIVSAKLSNIKFLPD
ncbi:unnamed protein product [Paramecium octaurelia]|uniref:Uncharacterized protein n=1 Tax=Paramecium octaurelia TaxID=43137 RepID=A0A8S1TEL1_PAROT|nr:unnamed protein product [Paramecium octaurelia]